MKNRGKEMKNRGKRIKTGANTQQVIKPPNSTRAQKPHKPRKARKQYKPTQTPQTTLKTALKREIKAYLRASHRKQSEKVDKRQGTHDQSRGQAQSLPQEPTTCNQWAHLRTGKTPPRKADTCNPFQKYVYFLPVVVSQIPEKTPSQANKI